MPPGEASSGQGGRAPLPKSVSSSHAYQPDSVLRGHREAMRVSLMELSLPEGNLQEWKPSPYSSVLSWKSGPWTWTSGKSVSMVTTFMDITAWLLVDTERQSPPTQPGGFPPARALPSPSPSRSLREQVSSARPPLHLSSSLWGGEQPQAQREEGRRCLCLPLVWAELVSQAVWLTRQATEFWSRRLRIVKDRFTGVGLCWGQKQTRCRDTSSQTGPSERDFL